MNIKAGFYETLQISLGLVGIPFQLLGKLLHEIHPFTIARKIQQGPYYWACVRKRRARGEEEWQEVDLLIGRRPPEGHPYWDRLERAGIPPLGDIIKPEYPVLREESPTQDTDDEQTS